MTTKGQELLRSKMSEEELQDAVVAMAKARSWLVMHTRPARTLNGWRTPLQGHSGFPDLVLVRSGRLIFSELKSAKGRVSPEQRLWLDELESCQRVVQGDEMVLDPGDVSPEVYIWRPADLDEIAVILK